MRDIYCQRSESQKHDQEKNYNNQNGALLISPCKKSIAFHGFHFIPSS